MNKSLLIAVLFLIMCGSCAIFRPCIEATYTGRSEKYGDVVIRRDCKGIYTFYYGDNWVRVSKDTVNVWVENEIN